MEKISWNDRVEDAEVLHTVKEERNILYTIRRKRITGLVTSGVGTAFETTPVKGRSDKETRKKM